ncbi:hypothetical protein SAMN05421681_107207 [Lysobacter enzymogenes]|nr:hypothetical protein SAMN05421681_107207 [Lysobacter enzymogenes]
MPRGRGGRRKPGDSSQPMRVGLRQALRKRRSHRGEAEAPTGFEQSVNRRKPLRVRGCARGGLGDIAI